MRARKVFHGSTVLFVFGCLDLVLLFGCGGESTKAPTSNTVPQQPISVTVTPGPVDVAVNSAEDFTATVANDASNSGVTWTVAGDRCSGASCGTITPTTSASGSPVVYRSPAAISGKESVTITATSVADSSKFSSVTVTIAATSERSVSISAMSATVLVNGTDKLIATVHNGAPDDEVTWSVSGEGCTAESCGTITPSKSASGASVTYTAPSNVPSPATIRVKATSAADEAKSATLAITITPATAISVSITPGSATVPLKGTQQFTATVTNDASKAGVRWRVGSTSTCEFGPAQCGTMSPATSISGVPVTYTASSSFAGVVPITATSITDPTKSATVVVRVVRAVAITVSISPTSASVAPDGNVEFAATVQNDPENKGLTWSLSGAGCSATDCGSIPSISASGEAVNYRAPSVAPNQATVTVTAKSIADLTKSASATVTITPASPGISVTITPSNATLPLIGKQQFSAFVANDSSNAGVQWRVITSCEFGPALCGSISPSSSASGEPVTYTAPKFFVFPQIVISATSVADPTRSARAVVTITR